MWLAIRTELSYFRPWLLGALAIAAAVTTFISVLFFLVDDGPTRAVAAGLRAFFPLIGGMVVGFIQQAYFSEERRARLLMAGRLTPKQMAAVVALTPALLFGLGAIVSGLVMGIEGLITGTIAPETLRIVSGVAGMLFASGQIGPLVQESTAARRQRRTNAMLLGWAVFFVVILLLTGSQFVLGTVNANVGQFLLGLLCMATSYWLYNGRNDFTR